MNEYLLNLNEYIIIMDAIREKLSRKETDNITNEDYNMYVKLYNKLAMNYNMSYDGYFLYYDYI